MDDDVTVAPTWLRNLTAALEDTAWAGSGGRIILEWPSALPRWLAIEGQYSRHPFPGFDQGQTPKELVGPPFGTNMAFRKAMFEKYGGFRTDLGPSPNPDTPPHSEDTEFGRRLITAGERLWYEPSAVVYHPITAGRLSRSYFLSWWFDRGRAEIRECVAQGISFRSFAHLAAWTARWMLAVRPSARFYRKLIVWQSVGQIVESCRLSESEKN
jgi:GT2 family glycosyltransferase